MSAIIVDDDEAEGVTGEVIAKSLKEAGLEENRDRTTFTRIRVDSERNRTSSVRFIRTSIMSKGLAGIDEADEEGVRGSDFGRGDATMRSELETMRRTSRF